MTFVGTLASMIMSNFQELLLVLLMHSHHLIGQNSFPLVSHWGLWGFLLLFFSTSWLNFFFVIELFSLNFF